jgi:hypothetical protein
MTDRARRDKLARRAETRENQRRRTFRAGEY